MANDGFCAAIRLDLHPQRKLAGPVRIAISSPTRAPIRLRALEHRLERQVLNKELIQTAIMAINQNLPRPLSQSEQIHLNQILQELI
jgi:hypothetical protein